MYPELDGIDFVIFYNNERKKWSSVDIRDREKLDGQDNPWYTGAYGNCLIWLKNARITDTLYLIKATNMVGNTWNTILNAEFLEKNAERYVTRTGIVEIPHMCKQVPRMRKTTVQKYLKYVIKTVTQGSGRTLYYVGENFIVDVVVCEHNKHNKNDLMFKWVTNGVVSMFLPTHVDIKTYYTDNNNNQISKYNIMQKRDPYNHRMTLNFDYVREATPENIEELVAECIRLYIRSCGNSLNTQKDAENG